MLGIEWEFLSAVVALLLGALSTFASYRNIARKSPAGSTQKKDYSQRFAELTQSLTKASSEMDEILREMLQVQQERETALSQLERQVGQLSEREKELQEKVKSLQEVPLPVAEYFAQLTEKGERRSARRDYMLFAMGVVVSAIASIVLRLFGIA